MRSYFNTKENAHPGEDERLGDVELALLFRNCVPEVPDEELSEFPPLRRRAESSFICFYFDKHPQPMADERTKRKSPVNAGLSGHPETDLFSFNAFHKD